MGHQAVPAQDRYDAVFRTVPGRVFQHGCSLCFYEPELPNDSFSHVVRHWFHIYGPVVACSHDAATMVERPMKGTPAKATNYTETDSIRTFHLTKCSPEAVARVWLLLFRPGSMLANEKEPL